MDISINQETGVVAGEVVNQFLEALPASRPLILVVKAFLKQREINEVFSGGLGSYSTVLIVISFLQVSLGLRSLDDECDHFNRCIQRFAAER